VAETVYHVEMRQFPHNMCRFNLSAQELRSAVLEPWAHNPWVEFGERKWVPHQATLTVIEGPRIPFGALTMGRGWRTAQREGREVTEELLGALARESPRATAPAVAPAAAGQAAGLAAGPATGLAAGQASATDLAADSLGLELLAQIGAEPAPLRRAWELAAERHAGSPASATLALAERAVESLLRGRLVVLLSGGGELPARDAPALGEEQAGRSLGEEQARRALEALASWEVPGAAGGLWVRRA
jgi:hypothetical protein